MYRILWLDAIEMEVRGKQREERGEYVIPFSMGRMASHVGSLVRVLCSEWGDKGFGAS